MGTKGHGMSNRFMSSINIGKDIPGFENYSVTEDGRVWSKERIVHGWHGPRKDKKPGRWLKLSVNKKNGYVYVSLSVPQHQSKSGTMISNKIMAVHVIVAKTYLPNQYNYPCINHKDFNKQNNNVSNLEWCTQQQNIDYCDKLPPW